MKGCTIGCLYVFHTFKLAGCPYYYERLYSTCFIHLSVLVVHIIMKGCTIGCLYVFHTFKLAGCPYYYERLYNWLYLRVSYI